MRNKIRNDIIEVYKITSPSGKIYIGQSINISQRKVGHRNEFNNPLYSSKLKNSFLLHGFENHTFEIIKTFETYSKEVNEFWERHCQDFYDVLGENGLNLVLTKTKLKNLVYHEEILRKIGEGSRLKVYTDEIRERMSKSHIGLHHSEETKSKIGKSNSKKVLNTETREIFNSIRDAANSIPMKPEALSERLCGTIKNNTNFQYHTE